MPRRLKLRLPDPRKLLRVLLASVALVAACGSCAAVHKAAKHKPATYGLAAMRVQRALGEQRTCYVEEKREAWDLAAYHFADKCVHVDPAQLAAVEARHGREAVDGILAHEFGHAIQHRRGDDIAQAGADAIAGCALYRLGEALSPFFEFLAEVDMPPDPPLEERGAALLSGAIACASQQQRSF